MDEKLNRLRQAALNDYTEVCVRLSEEMFLELGFKDSLLYGIAKAKSHLLIFEEMHPVIRWPREFLSLLEKLVPFDYSTPPFYFHGDTGICDKGGRPSPGSCFFLEGLDLLKSAFDHHLANFERVGLDLVGGAVNHILAARVYAHWGRLYPTEYAKYYDAWTEYAKYLDRVRRGDSENPEEAERLKRETQVFRKNIERRRFHIGLFLELADDIEKLSSDRNQDD